MADVETTVRHRTDDTATPVRHRDDAAVDRKSGSRRGRAKIRYRGALGYYICYSVFVAVVGLLLLAVLLTLHLARCVLVVSDTSVYDCFINLELGHARRHPRQQSH